MGAAALSGSEFLQTAHAAPAEPAWDETFDVIVVGSGLAGMVSAISAKMNGCERVVILEKMPVYGGNSAIAAGDICAVGSKQSLAQGIQDSVDLFVEDFTKAGEGRNHKDLTRAVGENSGRGIDMLVAHGARFHEKLVKHFGHSVPRVHQPVGGCANGVLAPLRKAFTEQYKGDIRIRVKMDEIVRDHTGTAVGLKVRENYDLNPDLVSDDLENTTGKVKHYKARYGIIMAYGGYARDPQFRREDFPLFNPLMVQMAGLGATGGALRAMMAAGARPFGLSFMRYGFDLAGGDTRFGCLVHPKTARRYINEAAPRPPLAQTALEIASASDGRFPIEIFDEDCVKAFEDPIRTKRVLRLGSLRPYPTLEALAAAEKLDYAALKETIDQYNALMAAGKDTQFGKDTTKMGGLQIRKAPFYASTLIPKANNTVGGVLVTPRAEVVSVVDGKPIPGLYAAGECASGMHGSASLPSASLVVGLSFGLVAGEQVAARKM